MCMLWSWYLANDTQFYLIGSIILIVAIRHFKFAAATLVTFVLSAWITTGSFFAHSKMPQNFSRLILRRYCVHKQPHAKH